MTEDHFRLMKPEAIFINTSRGATVDEPALIKALQEGWVAAAGIDVFEQEPPDPSIRSCAWTMSSSPPTWPQLQPAMDPERRRRVVTRLPWC